MANEMVEFWFAEDARFFSPKGYFAISLDNDIAYNTLRNRAFCRIWEAIVKDKLNDFVYHAEQAHLKFSFKSLTTGVKIVLKGFSDKLPLLALDIFQAITTIDPTAEEFSMWKDKVRRTLTNYSLDHPYQKVLERVSQLSSNPRWIPGNISDQFNSVTFEEFQFYRRLFISQARVTSLLVGNYTAEAAQGLAGALQERFFSAMRPVMNIELPLRLAVKYPPATNWLFIYPTNNPEEQNSSIQLQVQLGPRTHKLSATMDVLIALLEPLFFCALRNREQLGYIVGAGTSLETRVENIRFLVQSPKYSPLYLLSRTLNFIDAFGEALPDLLAQKFEAIVAAEIAKRDEMPKDAVAEGEHFWNEIHTTKEHLFNRGALEKEALQSLTKDDVIEMFKTKVSTASPERRYLIVAEAGSAHSAEAAAFLQGHAGKIFEIVEEQLPDAVERSSAAEDQPSEPAGEEEREGDGEGDGEGEGDGDDGGAGEGSADLPFDVPLAGRRVSFARIVEDGLWKGTCEFYAAYGPSA